MSNVYHHKNIFVKVTQALHLIEVDLGCLPAVVARSVAFTLGCKRYTEIDARVRHILF